MAFRADWRLPAMWMSLALLNIALTAFRFHKHGWHNTAAWIQDVTWFIILLTWSFMVNQSWHFDRDCLVKKRLLLPDVSIPYTSITSVDWTSQKNIALTLGGPPVFRGTERQIVMVRDMPGFLSEMERHVVPGVLHV